MAQEMGAHEPMLVRCTMKVPKRQAKQVGALGLAFGCGGATAKRTKQGEVEIEAVVEIRQVAEIVAKGVSVLVTERIPVEPVPASEITRDVEAWIAQIKKPVARRRR